jgi:S-adenosylmethionine hydrolase
MHKKPVVVLLTDFGLEDTFVGVMKGVILSICPDAAIIDLTHAVGSQNVRQAAFCLERSIPFFPDGSIFVCVVDPGVGTERRALAVSDGSRCFIAPDNGLLTPVIDANPAASCFTITDPGFMLASRSATFHGRDVFSPAAAHLASGIPITDLGERIETAACVRIQPYSNSTVDGGLNWTGEIISIDHFGNLITTFDEALVGDPSSWTVSAGNGKKIGILKTYADAEINAPLAYIGSSGMLEIAVRNGNAASALQVSEHDPVTLAKR